MFPKYTIYIPSKGRWDTRLTVKTLQRLGITAFYVVVEPQEYDNYAQVIPTHNILKLPFSNLGQGSIPARNFIWEHSLQNNEQRHWCIDDNIEKFSRYNRNTIYDISTPIFFRCMEDFADRYTNLSLVGPSYDFFVKRKNQWPSVVFNTRIYSCTLIDNSVPFRWRGRYNEDTDLSLRLLKAGYCTAQFNAFLQHKSTTMTLKGGNTDELYKGDGRLKMAQSLQEQHPDVVKVTYKFSRWQHSVDYRPFKGNKLIRKDNLPDFQPVDNYGMQLVARQAKKV